MTEAMEKPFGWRPFTDEYRESLKKLGMSDESIASSEAQNRYAPVDTAVISQYMGRAMLHTFAKKFGPDFVDAFTDEIRNAIKRDEESEVMEYRVDAKIGQEFLDTTDWEGIKALASDSGG